MSHTNRLFTFDTAGRPVPASADQVIAAARAHIAHRFRRGASLTSPAAMRDFLRLNLGTREFETFCCLFLDNRHRLIEFVELFRGTIDGASVHPREVVKEALARNAAAVVFVHYVAGHKMRLMCPGSFCARRCEVFIVEGNFVGRRHITTGSSQGMPSPAELDGWLHGVIVPRDVVYES